MTFKELYLSGQVPFEEIDRYISRWNRSDDERTLAKYLGLNADEEDVWIDDSDEALKETLDARERVAGTPVTLGKTDIIVNKNGFGALPIQRISFDDAKVLLRKAYDAGVRFFDTARFYTDSEEKIGYALSDVREHIYIATKTAATTAEGFWKDLETSLHNLKTDYVDIYQFHNPAFCPKPGGEDGLYDAALEAKKQGKIRHISITNHRLAVAQEAIDSGLYASLQFPFSYLAGEQELALVEGCRAHGMGFIAMKGMAGGLLRRLDRSGLDGGAGKCGAHLGCAAGERAGSVFAVHPRGYGADGRAPRNDRARPPGALRRVLPRLRLLYAVPRGH